MARAGDPYGGALGRTRTEPVHYSCSCGFIFAVDVHRSVNVNRDPALGTRLMDGSLGNVTCPSCSAAGRIDVPVVYHDEPRRRMLLVLPLWARHREIEERIELLQALARDRGHPVPAYVRDFAVVFGGDELKRAVEAPAPRRVDDRAAELERLAAKLARRQAELDELSAALERRGRDLETRAGAPAEEPAPLFGELAGETPLSTMIDESTGRFAMNGGPSGDDSGPLFDLVAAEKPRPAPARDASVVRWRDARTQTGYVLEAGDVRLLLRLAGRPPSGTLQVRVQLQRMASYPLVVIAVIADDGSEPMAVCFDVERPDDRRALGVLCASFHLVIDFFDDAYEPLARREVILPLAANVRYVLALADETLSQLPAARRSFEAAVAAWRAPGHDSYGRREPRLDEDSFAQLATAAAAQKAVGVVAGWSEPDNEDYLILVRSFPLEWWRRIRSRVITRAAELGLVLPGVLVEVAVSDGLFRSRKELVARTLAAFAELAAARDKNDLDPDQMAANWRALLILCEEEGVAVEPRILDLARAGGGVSAIRSVVVVQPRDAGVSPVVVRPASGRARGEETGRIAVPLDASSVVASRPVVRRDVRTAAVTDLIEMLDDKDARLGAALELCRRVDATAVGPVFGALRRMARGEAVRVLPGLIKFGERSVPHLVDGLRSRKAYLRQGSALALGVLKSADGIGPLCELLLTEPTDVWREVARALGEIGGGAVMSLTARLRDPEVNEADARERVAWALAHILAKGGRAAVESLASGRDAIAAGAARRALDLAATARDNDAEVRGPVAPHDQTVNRAFSRRFFEAMGGVTPPSEEDAEAIEDDSISLEEELEAAEILVDDEMLEEEDLVQS